MPRGRSRTVTATARPLIPGEKLPPPAELSPAQALVWRRIIDPLPTGWITAENSFLLVALCRHVDHCDRLAIDIEAARSEAASAASEASAAESVNARKAAETRRRRAQSRELALLRLHVLESSAVARLSQKLRLTKLSRYTRDAEGAAIAARNAGPQPWNDWGGGGRQ
jgi:hypothetical protein